VEVDISLTSARVVLLKLSAQFNKAHWNLRLLLVGDGPLRQ
jgi:hypothetical protein